MCDSGHFAYGILLGHWLVAWICFTSNVSKMEFFVFSDNKCKLAVPFNDLGSSKCMRVAQRMISKTDL